ncbi:MAG: glycosyltransferase [Myxococcales bacterium]
MNVGLVAIGRNEGERLKRCLLSARAQVKTLVYVDSGSSDGSVDFARSLGVHVVELDTRRPFTAGRARNEGARKLREVMREAEFVQFVDGDCELDSSWIARGLAEFAARPGAAVICGRRRERFPEASVYNRLCDNEWNTPVGLAAACGGDFMVRLGAFEQVQGFASDLIAGEEPDLCFRMRQAGHEIWRVDAEMTLHDAAMTEFAQWWLRNLRSGHASAEAWARRGSWAERQLLKDLVSNVMWSLPVAWPAWPVLFMRVYQRSKDPTHAAFIVLGKLPHSQGQLKYWFDRVRGGGGTLIEYK